MLWCTHSWSFHICIYLFSPPLHWSFMSLPVFHPNIPPNFAATLQTDYLKRCVVIMGLTAFPLCYTSSNAVKVNNDRMWLSFSNSFGLNEMSQWSQGSSYQLSGHINTVNITAVRLRIQKYEWTNMRNDLFLHFHEKALQVWEKVWRRGRAMPLVHLRLRSSVEQLSFQSYRCDNLNILQGKEIRRKITGKSIHEVLLHFDG